MKNLNLVFGLMLLVNVGYSQLQWEPQMSGSNSYLTDVHFTDQFNGWISGVTGLVLHTSDGGQNWIEQDTPPNNVYYSVYFTDSQNGWACGFAGKIIHTSDGGETWESQVSGVNTDLYDVFFIDENIGWIVGGDNGGFPNYDPHRLILHTTNGGASWVQQIYAVDQYRMNDVHFCDVSNGWTVGESGGVLKTNNGGLNWQETMQGTSYHFYGVYCMNSTTTWVVGQYLGLPHVPVIFTTEDGGDTWESQTFDQDENLNAIYFTDTNHGFAIGGTTEQALIMYTTDGGSTWTSQYPNVNTFLSAASFIDNSTGWAVGNLGTIISSSTTTDIKNQISENVMNIYPNPASDQINIELSLTGQTNTSLAIYNSVGKLVYSKTPGLNIGNLNSTIDLSKLSEGLYTIYITSGAKTSTEKLIIQR